MPCLKCSLSKKSVTLISEEKTLENGMSIWALADTHLAFGVPEKSMDLRFPAWVDYTKRIKENWDKCIQADDLVLIPGDISWAMTLDEALVDLKWIDALPGTKVILKGNHDYWWPSHNKLVKVLPKSIHLIDKEPFHWKNVSIGGARLWDTSELSFTPYIHFEKEPKAAAKTAEELAEKLERDEKIFQRELLRLKTSLSKLNPEAEHRIAMTHFPPISANLQPSKASALMEEFNINISVFGHLHSVKKEDPLFGEKNGVRYILTAADYLNFFPINILN